MAVAAVRDSPTTAGNVQQAAVPFRRATLERTDVLPSESNAISAARVPIERTIEGTGYIYGIQLEVVANAAANAATVVYAEDAPWNSLDLIIYKDVNGELINLSGFDLYLANLAMKQYVYRFQDQSAFFTLTAGAGGTGGTFNFQIRVPVAVNRRDLLGVVGNQDRAQKYTLRTDQAASTAIYTTPPTTLPTMTIAKTYENYAVPMLSSATGAKQMPFPDSFGTLHFLTSTVSEAAPSGGSVINHYLRRIGNTIRYIILVFRSNGSRLTASQNVPTSISLKVGDDTQFTESYNYRRFIMFERYGFDFPNGVLVYDAMHDFNGFAGGELGDDYWHTQQVTQAQFMITYPVGFGSTNNSLKFITDDLLYQAPVAGLTSVVAGR